MNKPIDKTKRHFIRGVVKKNNMFYVPLVQVAVFCHRFPEMTSKHIGDMIDDALKGLESNEELLKKVPEVKETDKIDGGRNEGSSEKKT